MLSSTALFIVLILLVVRLVAQLVLSALNRAEVRRHAHAAPPAVAAVVDAETYQKSVAYTLAKNRFGVIELIFDAALLAVILTSGVIPWLYDKIIVWGPGTAWAGAVFILIAGIVLSLPGMPLDWWENFRLEARFGFNKSTTGLWIADKIKGLALSLIIGFPLLWALLALVGVAGNYWWVWGFALFFGFQLLMMVLYPRLIVPLFNKLTPLPEGELRTRLMALSERTGFKASTIEVIDGSKRSGHSNAYFTGFGRFRRIVLFDTLVSQLTPGELEAVLAHEVGHYRCGHIPRMLAVSALMVFGGFALVAWLANSAWFNPGFGLPAGDLAPAFLLFGLLSGLVTFWLTPVGGFFSRKHEYEADAFAREAMGGPDPLIAALHKLSGKNLSNLTPHPVFSAFYYSHPTLVEREAALLGKAEKLKTES